MIFSRRPEKILEQVYPEAIIKDVDNKDIKQMMEEFTLSKCKIVLNGNNLLDAKEIGLPDPISKQKKEKWIGAKYRIYKKPNNLELSF